MPFSKISHMAWERAQLGKGREIVNDIIATHTTVLSISRESCLI